MGKNKDNTITYTTRADDVRSTVEHESGSKPRKKEPITALKNELIASEVRFHRLFETAKDGILIIDAETGMIIKVNSSLVDLLGYPKEEFFEKEIWEIGFLKDIINSKDEFLEMQQKGLLRYDDLPFTTADGRKLDIEFICNIYVENKRQIIQCIIRDITERKRTEESLTLLETRYRRLFESAKDGILILDADTGKIIDVNPFLIELLGYSKENFVDKELWEIGSFKDIAANEKKFLELQQKRYVRYDNLPLETADGRKISVEFVSNVYLMNKKSVIQCNIRDITERKHSEEILRQSEEKFRSYIDHAPDGVFVTDETGRYIDVNESACKMSGYSRSELLLMSIPEILSEDSLEKGLSQFRKLNEGGTSRTELSFKHKDGFKRWWSVDSVKIAESRFLGFTKDITERKIAEKELIEAKEKAEESDRLKSAFLANMSHEIRTPMNGILGFTELLKEPHLTDEKQQEYIGIIEKSGVRMLNIINDIICISKVESGQMDIYISDTNINEQIEDVYNFFKQETTQKKLDISYKSQLSSKESTVRTDKDKILAVLTNLVKNAIKFTNKGSIEFGYILKTDSVPAELEFYVKDTGMGIPQAQKKLIFDRFRQGSESLTRNYEGSGLGLTISKAYVEMLGGKIWVESNSDNTTSPEIKVSNGSTFFFTIPYIPVLEI